MIKESRTDTLSAKEASSSLFISSKCCRRFALKIYLFFTKRVRVNLVVLEQIKVFVKTPLEFLRFKILVLGYVIFVVLEKNIIQNMFSN